MNIPDILSCAQHLNLSKFIRRTTHQEITSRNTLYQLSNKFSLTHVNGIAVDINKELEEDLKKYSNPTLEFKDQTRAILLQALSRLCFAASNIMPNVMILDELINILNPSGLCSTGYVTITHKLLDKITECIPDSSIMTKKCHHFLHLNFECSNLVHISFCETIHLNNNSDPSLSIGTQIDFSILANPDHTFDYDNIKLTINVPHKVHSHKILSKWNIIKINCKTAITNFFHKITACFTRKTYIPTPKFKIQETIETNSSEITCNLSSFTLHALRHPKQIQKHLSDFRQAFNKAQNLHPSTTSNLSTTKLPFQHNVHKTSDSQASCSDTISDLQTTENSESSRFRSNSRSSSSTYSISTTSKQPISKSQSTPNLDQIQPVKLKAKSHSESSICSTSSYANANTPSQPQERAQKGNVSPFTKLHIKFKLITQHNRTNLTK
ncbi:hypothetical protein EDL79_01310 [Ehrlichia ruminantium]|uniref:Uncharacterized protein n=1 Tax=Ehrlichia ruminantium TaxID=779 RepID=A0AAE6UKK1_EHRRU|nr:hypothetical protein [Ehrlichia ruminantium]QGR02318.1 hypothetical protein EDL81_01310 [Ehrlichia ruminantium]QGR03238.1 hypothetical protein EDL80_01310 [Ehrlichia ruminantium]QGR04163.1 hypothetical protein EDL79_01310 [Ehrlichia ruminantium]